MSRGLRTLTRTIDRAGLSEAALCGFFGGAYGYGADFSCDVFSMHYDRQHPECDCGAAKPIHQDSCDIITKGPAWLKERNLVGMVKVEGDPPWGGFYQNTDTTWDEQDLWMKENPYPSCSCGEVAAWTERNGHAPRPDGASYFDRGGDHWTDYEHAEGCDLSIYHQPCFLHKPSGSTVNWYKYIGRDMRLDLKAPWRDILKECLAAVKAMA